MVYFSLGFRAVPSGDDVHSRQGRDRFGALGRRVPGVALPPSSELVACDQNRTGLHPKKTIENT